MSHAAVKPISVAPPDAFLPYGRQTIEDDDIAAVVAALKSDALTTGPRVEAFEQVFAAKVGAKYAVVCSNGTAALHMAMIALGVGPGDLCIVPSITFLATANAARFQGADVLFADVDPDTGLMTPETLAAAFARAGGRPVKAVLPVHLAGRSADMAPVVALAAEHGAAVVEDACHALGTRVGEHRVGDCRHSAMACFSFHPVKTIATAEGGMVTTNDAALAQKLRAARSHGMTRDPAAFENHDLAFDHGEPNPWYYEQHSLGLNYRLPDVLCALGLSQLEKLDRFVARRAELAARYDALLRTLAPLVRSVPTPSDQRPGLHLQVALIDFAAAGRTRRAVMEAMRAEGIGTQVHYIPVHRQPYYRALYGEQTLPGADAYYARCLSLPLFPTMRDDDPARVVRALARALGVN